MISYDAKVKEDLLKVPPEIIKKYGEVSREVAQLMAKGAQRCCHSDIGISITGIAGPGEEQRKRRRWGLSIWLWLMVKRLSPENTSYSEIAN